MTVAHLENFLRICPLFKESFRVLGSKRETGQEDALSLWSFLLGLLEVGLPSKMSCEEAVKIVVTKQ